MKETKPALDSLQVRLERLLSLLSQDPGNLHLLRNTAAAAFDVRRFRLCEELLARYESIQQLPPSLMNLRGLSAMSAGRFEAAVADFLELGESNRNPTLQYNIAYASAMQGIFEPAALLGAACLDTIPGAALLKLQALHRLERFDEAVHMAAPRADHPDSPSEFVGAYAALLFDMNKPDQARLYASRSPESVDSLAITGLMELEAGNLDRATELLGQASDRNPREARAVLGRGLCLLAEERYAEAASILDRAAEQLPRHAGSWLAAGWAWLFDGNSVAAGARFQHATTIDRGFAEAHGSLAVALRVQGRHDNARHHAEIALRLDPTSLSAALAKTLEIEAANEIVSTHALKEAILNRPFGTPGRTLAKSLTTFGLGRARLST
ncbi:tetratricopeptide repeat protein [Burkholderia stabilis]|nr:tetratricopeptide repeat protein [Burkholderia stabilis]